MPDLEVTVTGTGSPQPDPDRAGPGVLVRYGDVALQFDTGRGTVMRLSSAGCILSDLDAVFITHHHSDHMVALDDVVMTRWIVVPMDNVDCSLPVIAPKGAASRFAEHVLDNWQEDIEVRKRHTGRQSSPEAIVYSFDASDDLQEVWSKGDVRVSAIRVEHPPVEPSVAFRIDTPGGSAVVSGDTRICAGIETACKGAQIVVHEAMRTHLFEGTRFKRIAEYHASTIELGQMAARLRIPDLMLTHLMPAPRSPDHDVAFEKDIRSGDYDGRIAVARDLHKLVVS
jgi:ribonuclease Z